MNEILSKIRPDSSPSPTLKQIFYSVFKSLAFGMLLGLIAKYSDTIPSNGFVGLLWGTISDVTTRLGIWVLLATIISTWSSNPLQGALKVFSFFVGMLFTYYIYTMWIFNFFPMYYFIGWGAIALVSPIAAYIVWFSRREGWLGTICAAMPIGFLLAQGYSVFYTVNIATGFDIFFALILLLLTLVHKKPVLLTFLTALLFGYMISVTDVVARIFGGL